MKVAFLQAGSCWGCHQSLLNSHLSLISILPDLEIVYWAAIMDFKLADFRKRLDQSVDVGFIEGFVRTEADKDNIILWRQKCKIIIAFGACACMGSVGGLANMYPIDELLSRKFEDEEYLEPGSKIPSVNLPKILDFIPDLHSVIKIDIDLPGCPPVSGNIMGLISSLIGQISTKIDTNKSVCEICPLKVCMLNENRICYGPITAISDNLELLSKGYPILGEYGLTHRIHVDNALKLLDLLISKPHTVKELHIIVEAMLLLLKGSYALQYPDGRIDAIRQTKLAPEKLQMKKIGIPSNIGETVEIVNVYLSEYPEIISDIIGASLVNLKNNSEYDESALTVCSSCPNNTTVKNPKKYKRDYEGFPDPHICFLVQDYVCMGPITRAGCGTLCPKANSPCSGCYGPALNISDYGAKALSYFPSICTDTPENIAAFFKDPIGIFNRFSVVASKLGHYVPEEKKSNQHLK